MIHQIVQPNSIEPIIGLTGKDLEEWMDYQKHQGEIKKLINTGVFDIKNGVAELHFNSSSVIMDITATVKLLKKI